MLLLFDKPFPETVEFVKGGGVDFVDTTRQKLQR